MLLLKLNRNRLKQLTNFCILQHWSLASLFVIRSRWFISAALFFVAGKLPAKLVGCFFTHLSFANLLTAECLALR